MNPSIRIYTPGAADQLNPDFELRLLASGFRFTEGPVYLPSGSYLFSDIPANCIYAIGDDGQASIYLEQSGTSRPDHPDLNADQPGSNGLARESGGALLICQHGGHAVARYHEGELRPYIASYGGRPFNSPNDLVLHSNGSLFFSDPPYGLKGGKLNPAAYQPVAGVYRWIEDELQLVCDSYQYPNGVCLSPDETELFICSNKPFEKRVSVYDAATLAFRRIAAEENGDGIETDPAGNLYLCNREGLLILDPRGERLALIELPTVPANCCWGGEGGKDLFITARENLFLARQLRF